VCGLLGVVDVALGWLKKSSGIAARRCLLLIGETTILARTGFDLPLSSNCNNKSVPPENITRAIESRNWQLLCSFQWTRMKKTFCCYNLVFQFHALCTTLSPILVQRLFNVCLHLQVVRASGSHLCFVELTLLQLHHTNAIDVLDIQQP